MKLSIIVAFDENGVIGHNNQIPWSLPNDLKHVRAVTMGHSIVLGRKNHESIGKALPGRRNIVLTRNKAFIAPGCEVVHAMEDVFFLCSGEEEVFIFGGTDIYELFMPYVQKMYVTRIHHAFEGDTFFPKIDWDQWDEPEEAEQGVTDEKNQHSYAYHIYTRK
jgi:dihydrofolate reductase